MIAWSSSSCHNSPAHFLRSPERSTTHQELWIRTCSDLITSDARLDYSADFDWDYLRIRARSC
jgi:hypothetical protein